MSTGAPIVEGIGVGRAVRWRDHPAPRPVVGTLAEEQGRLARGVEAARRGLGELVRLLPRSEVELFEPELLLIDELGGTLRARLRPDERAEDVVLDVLSGAKGDLILDARARILDAIARDPRTVEEHLDGSDGEMVLVTSSLTPSVVASLPARVVAIVAATSDPRAPELGQASHTAILARARGIPIAALSVADVDAIAPDEVLVVDTTGPVASVDVAPTPRAIEEAAARRAAWAHEVAEAEAQVAAPLDHLGVEVLANIGSLQERAPTSAEGIGLLRTELLFFEHRTPPSEAEQFGAMCAIASRAPRSRVVVRLFDAGADKAVAWLPAPPGDSARGISLLCRHAAVLDTQLRALLRARQHGKLEVLVPFVERAAEVAHVRARLRGQMPVGALVESPAGVQHIDEIALAADFISIGTNDLSASVLGERRTAAGVSLDARVLALVGRVIESARARGRAVTVCGEMAGDPNGSRILVGLGATALSVAPTRIAPIKVSPQRDARRLSRDRDRREGPAGRGRPGLRAILGSRARRISPRCGKKPRADSGTAGNPP